MVYDITLNHDVFFQSNEHSTVKTRWAPVNSERKEKTKSLNVPQKLDIKEMFCNEPISAIDGPKKEVEKELNEIRESRPTPLTKRWKPKPYQKVGLTFSYKILIISL